MYPKKLTTVCNKISTGTLSDNTTLSILRRLLSSGTWVGIAHPAAYGLWGGHPMNEFYNNGLSHENEACTLSIHHQVHCAASFLASWSNIEWTSEFV